MQEGGRSFLTQQRGALKGEFLPESRTKRTPSIVTEVSAMLVERMHLRTPGGGTSNT